MSEVIGVLFFVFYALFALLFVGGIIYLIVYLAKNKDKKSSFNMNTLLHIYFYIVSIASLAISVIGLVVLINALASYKLGIPFSYQVREINSPTPIEMDVKEAYDIPDCYEGTPVDIEGQKVCFDTEKQKSDIVNGISFFVSMMLIFIIHKIGLHYIEKKEKFVWLKKIYNFVSLIGYSILGIISIPMATYLLVNYFYFRPEDITKINPPSIPVAISLVTIPLWIIFLVKTLRTKETGEEK